MTAMIAICAALGVIAGASLLLWLRGLAVIAGLRDRVERLELRAAVQGQARQDF